MSCSERALGPSGCGRSGAGVCSFTGRRTERTLIFASVLCGSSEDFSASQTRFCEAESSSGSSAEAPAQACEKEEMSTGKIKPRLLKAASDFESWLLSSRKFGCSFPCRLQDFSYSDECLLGGGLKAFQTQLPKNPFFGSRFASEAETPLTEPSTGSDITGRIRKEAQNLCRNITVSMWWCFFFKPQL